MKELKNMVNVIDNSLPYEESKSKVNSYSSNDGKVEMCTIIDKSIPYEESKKNVSCVDGNGIAGLVEMCKVVDHSVSYEDYKNQKYGVENDCFINQLENSDAYGILTCDNRGPLKTMVTIVNNDTAQSRNPLMVNEYVKAVETNIKYYSDDEKTSGFTFYNNVLSYNNEPFLNCCIEITDLVIGEKQSFYRCTILLKSNLIKIDVAISEYSLAKWINEIPGVAFLGLRNRSKELLFLYLQELVSNLDLSKQIKLYKSSGWRKINTKYMYVTPSGVVGDETIKAISENGQKFGQLVSSPDSFKKYLSFIDCTRSNVATILVLYLSMSLCNSLYREADFTPKFTVFLHGPRGNFKTSLALALTQIEYKDTPTYTLKATKAGLEAGFRGYRDSVMLIDDLAPTQVSSDRRSLLSNLEVIVRAFGDGTGLVRNFDYLDKEKAREIEQYKAEGGAVITGEFFEGCQSSLARCVFLELNKNDVDLNMLTELQNDKHIVENFAFTFISSITFLLNNTDSDVVSFIKNRGKEIRKLFSLKFSNERYGEYIAQLQVTADLLMYIARCFSLLRENEITYYNQRFTAAIQEVINSNNHTLNVQSPLTVLCNAIYYNLDSESCCVVNLGESIVNLSNVILQDSEYYYITQKVCKTLVNDYIKEHSINLCEFTSTSVADTLHSADIIDFYQEDKVVRKGRKLPNYGSLRFMKISKAKLNEHIDF